MLPTVKQGSSSGTGPQPAHMHTPAERRVSVGWMARLQELADAPPSERRALQASVLGSEVDDLDIISMIKGTSQGHAPVSLVEHAPGTPHHGRRLCCSGAGGCGACDCGNCCMPARAPEHVASRIATCQPPHPAQHT